MSTKFRKIDPRIWRDERFTTLGTDEKLVALYCLIAQSNRCGIFVFSPAMAAEELGTSPQTFRERFRKVVSALRWRWDEDRRVLYFPTWWKYNPPENANVLSGNLKDLSALPETPLLAEFCGNTRYLPPALRETFRERMGERYPKPCRDQEQEKEQEQYPYPADAGVGLEGVKEPDPEATPPRRKKVADESHFARFWSAYPRKVAKADAAKAFAKLAPDESLLGLMLAALEWQSRSDGWLKEGGKYVPYPATWLNTRRWEDECPTGLRVHKPPDPAGEYRDFLRRQVAQQNMTREEAEEKLGGPLYDAVPDAA